MVAASTSATAWLLDPAIEKIFLNKDQTLIFLIPYSNHCRISAQKAYLTLFCKTDND